MRGEHDPALPGDRQTGAIAVPLGTKPGTLVEEDVQHYRLSLGGRPRFGGVGGFTVPPRRPSASRRSTPTSALALRSSLAAIRSEDRSVGKTCVMTCKSRGSASN